MKGRIGGRSEISVERSEREREKERNTERRMSGKKRVDINGESGLMEG